MKTNKANKRTEKKEMRRAKAHVQEIRSLHIWDCINKHHETLFVFSTPKSTKRTQNESKIVAHQVGFISVYLRF